MGGAQTTYFGQGGIDGRTEPYTELLPNLLTKGGDGLKNLVESVLNQVLETQITEYLGLTGMSARKNGRATGTEFGNGR